MKQVGRDVTVALAQGEGTFVVAALCEQLASEDADADARKTVKGWFDAKTRKAIKDADSKGVKVLLEGLEKL